MVWKTVGSLVLVSGTVGLSYLQAVMKSLNAVRWQHEDTYDQTSPVDGPDYKPVVVPRRPNWASCRDTARAGLRTATTGA